MDPDNEGWKKVLPRIGGERLLSRAELEIHERQILKEWENSRGHWSGIGKHTPAHDFAEAKKLHNHRFKRPSEKPLGSGSFGYVEKVHYVHTNRTICLARKHIPYQRRRTIQLMREEANVMERLDHDHIVKLVGTYCVKPNELFILLWPVAVCNLDELFNDLDALKHGHDDQETLARMEGLELNRQEDWSSSASNYLRPLIGCIARAVAYCHEANIRHLDLKPSNILLGPGRVYLADFGIARDVHDRDHTMTIGPQGTPKWRAPEILNQDDEWSMKAADVYSMGLILLNIATVLYGADLADFDAVVSELVPRRRAEKLEAYIAQLATLAVKPPHAVADPSTATFAPRHILELTSRMLSSDPSSRPVATEVDNELVELGGLEQIYHSSCCRRDSHYVVECMSNRFKRVTDRMSHQLKLVGDHRDQLLSDNEAKTKRLEVLERKDETYEARIQNERNSQREKLVNLQNQLDKERAKREQAEALVEEMKRATTGKRLHQPRPPMPRVPATAPAPPTGPRIAAGPTIRTRQTHPLPGRSSPCTVVQPQPERKASVHVATSTAQPTYLSQTAASANRATSNSTPLGGPMRRVSIPRPSAAHSPGISPGISNCPTPELPGYPLRSRNSGSRLPQPVNPTTPIRSGTPTLSRDPSSTDSTQFSMISSTFSRLSGHSSRQADTSVAGTPAMESSPFDSNKTTERVTNHPTDSTGLEGVGLGLGLVSTASRRPSVISERTSLRGDAASVTSATPAVAATSVGSPVLSASGGNLSTLSSPRANYRVLDSQTGHIKLPGLPTARSWAEVANTPVAVVSVGAGVAGRR